MTLEELKAELERKSKEELIKQIKGIPVRVQQIVDNGITTMMCNAMGLSGSFGRWEVDHCNGRATQLANQIGVVALEAVQLALPDFIATLVVDETGLRKIFNEAARKEYEDQIRKEMHCKMWEFTKNEAERRSKMLIDMVTPETFKDTKQA